VNGNLLYFARVVFESLNKPFNNNSPVGNPSLHPTERKVLLTVLEHQMINSGDTIVVAVSGGPDSVCLLRILFQLQRWLNTSLVVAHLNHGLRPGEDERETEFVTNVAKSLNLIVAYDKATNLPKAHCSSLEENAREIRYQFLEKVSHEYRAQKVALGHNMNDQAETVLMHLLRGTGPTGLSGIPLIRQGHFIRPLLNITREEIYAYLKQKDMPFMTDSSNLEKRYLRNKIRLELIPLLLNYQPRLIQHLSELASLCGEENQFIEGEAEKGLEMMILDSSDHSLDLSLAAFKDLSAPLQYRVVRQAIKQVKGSLRRIDIGHIKAVVALANNPRPQIKINLPENLVVKKIYEGLRVSLGPETETEDFSYSISDRARLQIPEINQTLSIEEISGWDFSLSSASPNEAFLDLDRLQWPLRVRNFRAGDKFIPLGLNGFKKVKDVFIDNKIPTERRRKVAILEDGSSIVWVCGIRIDDRYRVTGETKRILRCKMEGDVL
jgi:tRNA(Ile)-lysidine synthase